MLVPIHELKSNPSKYLRLAKEGESVIITSHNTAVAKILPIEDQNLQNVTLRQLSNISGFHWNGKKPQGGKLLPKIEGQTASDRVLEDRG